jgi:hypothetical protein
VEIGEDITGMRGAGELITGHVIGLRNWWLWLGKWVDDKCPGGWIFETRC